MDPKNIQFNISKEVLNLGVSGIYLVISGLKNKERDKEFEVYKTAVLNELLKVYSVEGFVESEPILRGFRELHTKVGRSNRRFISAPEVLITRFLRIHKLPHINLLVDIYNLVSLKTRLAFGAHDIKKIDGNVYLKLTTGNESYVPLGAQDSRTIFPGEYCYADESDEVLCRMEVLQCDKTKINLTTTDCFYIIQGNKNTSNEYLLSAVEELINLTKKYCGGESKILYIPEE